MKVLLVFLVGVIAAVRAVSFFELVHEEWKSFKGSHNKLYGDDTEEKFRMKIFMENKHKIAKHNQLYDQGKVPFKLAINKFADLLPHEFSSFNGYNKTLLRSVGAARIDDAVTFVSPANVELPETVDWRKKGAVTPIKDQGHCGSCWSFSATGALEGQHFRKTGVLVSLSEQNLVDCSAVYGNNGCNGGLMDNAFRYIKDNGGIDTEKTYPYEAKDDTCRYDAKNSGATDKGFVDIDQGNEQKMKEALATIGPVAVAIDASHQSFQFYSEGVYYEPECDAENLDHGVLVVGYGTDEATGSDYWIVKKFMGNIVG